MRKTSMKLMNKSLWDLPSSSSMNYMWNMGSMLGTSLAWQISTGLTISMFYSSTSETSFTSLITLMNEVWNGWMIRLMHMNGASMMFMLMYLHLFRGLYYMSSKNKMLWVSGIFMMIMMMSISFMGYVLPWGQMSYWAVAVITNLFSVMPIIGESMVTWMWGSFSVDNPTLMRFYSLHFITPIMMAGMSMLHLMILHKNGSSNSMSMPSSMDKIQFHPYYTIKDLLPMIILITTMMMMVTNIPYITLDPVNNVPSNPMQTPPHIKPEWYFLTSYTILRSIPNKTMGVLALIMSMMIYLSTMLFKMKFSPKFSMMRNLMFWSYLSSFMIMMKMGSMPAEEPMITMGMFWSTMFFSSIILMNM